MPSMPKVLAKFQSTITAIPAHHTFMTTAKRWGIDIIGLLAIAQGNYKYAKPLVNINAMGLKRFF